MATACMHEATDRTHATQNTEDTLPISWHIMNDQVYIEYIPVTRRANFNLLLPPEESLMNSSDHPLNTGNCLLHICVNDPKTDLGAMVGEIESNIDTKIDLERTDLYVHTNYTGEDGNSINQHSMPDLELRKQIVEIINRNTQ
ncbi:hypothetical protein GF389_06325 [Candidatus Dojkabacteria bacterium]|nr:hypothetical protein [Candidatus Dojkabacteria bacterium]